ncbi:HAMP domain-containing protein [Paenibacillus sp. LMG 31460]|uniref:HAMP domain-containing protein n=1 Tax=Paenibacillus germinis TaxID=2654979 RepID=A0ABX1YZK3_9BACL|nr:histidine kinase [Paenibacillus germinis]NOU85994.1 HAMP domain-containing protein [Paenibacillus germinis]
MNWLMRFSFYRKTQLSFSILILLPLVFVSILSYFLIKGVVIDKVHASNQNVVDVISSDLNKNVEDIIYASYLFSNKGSSLFSDLLAFKDVQKLNNSKDYFTNKRISEFLDMSFSKTSGLNAQVFFVNKSHYVIYATNNSLDYPDLTRWLSEVNNTELNKNVGPIPIRWMEVDHLKQSYSSETESYYFAVKVISDPDNGDILGTLYVGIPHEYFARTFARGGTGQFQLYTTEGELIYQYPKEAALPERKHELEVQNNIPKVGWKLVYKFSSQEITAEISRMFSIYAIILSMCILSFLIISVFIAKTLHTPLNKLRKTAEQFGNGNRLVRFPVSGKDEVAVLGLAFNRMLDQINLLIAEVEQEQEEKRIIELDALFSQIRPHFLLNTLNSIKCNLATEGDSINSRQIDALMSLLRAYMRVNEPCYLKQECKLLVDYVEIMQMRNDMRLQLHIDLSEELEDMEVPRLVLQPLVENAIVHGFSEIPEHASIWVSAEQSDGECLIEVKDNGTGMNETEMKELLKRVLQSKTEPQASNQRIGLANVYNRLRLTYGTKVNMDIRSNEFGGLSIILHFPRI